MPVPISLEASLDLLFFDVISILTLFVLWGSPRWILWGWLWLFQIVASEWCFGLGLILGTFGFWRARSADGPGSWISVGLSLLSAFACGVEIARHRSRRNLATGSEFKISWFRSLWIPFQQISLKPFLLKGEGNWSQTGVVLGDPSSAAPLVIVIHGGAWTHGDARQLPAVMSELESLGFAVLSINYLRLPKHHWPEIEQDVARSITEILRLRPTGASTWLYGRSAGGHIALLMGQRFSQAVSGIVALYPVTEMFRFYQEGREYDVLNTRRLLRKLLRGSPRENAAAYTNASPALFEGGSMPPTLLVHGGRDPLVPLAQSQAMVAALEKSQSFITRLILPRASHGFDGHWNGPSSQIFRKALMDFLQSVPDLTKRMLG